MGGGPYGKVLVFSVGQNRLQTGGHGPASAQPIRQGFAFSSNALIIVLPEYSAVGAASFGGPGLDYRNAHFIPLSRHPLDEYRLFLLQELKYTALRTLVGR